ncbi:MAG: phosphotransferase family protein [Novosphingobium sp.]|jgi:aminoglycoside phosphotransferase (APT) family kinase protein|nr:phosphotransferase family protein [Novosphingobium sp.]
MYTGQLQLLSVARRALQESIDQTTQIAVATALQGVDAVLNELMLRQDGAFFADHYRHGITLAREGIALLRQDMAERAGLLPGLAELDVPSGDDVSGDTWTRRYTQLSRLLRDLSHAFADDDEGKPIIAAMFAWEERLYAHATAAAQLDAPPQLILSMFTPESLCAYLRQARPDWEVIAVRDFDPVPGGFSKATVRFSVEDGHGKLHEMVLRVEPAVSTLGLHSQDLAAEYQVLQLARQHDLAVPEPILFEADAGKLGLRFLISARAKGINCGSFRSASSAISMELVRDAARTLAQISHVQPDRDDPLAQRSHLGAWAAHDTLGAATEALVRYWYDIATARGVVSPTIAHTYEWLIAHVPHCDGRPSLVHGDFGFHNMLVAEDRVSAVLDWEASYLGDPAADLCNFLFSTQGAVERDDLLRFYAQAGGVPIDAERLAYFDLFNAFKITIGSIAPLHLLNERNDAPLSFAVLGLQYPHFSIARIPDLLRRADAAQNAAGPPAHGSIIERFDAAH